MLLLHAPHHHAEVAGFDHHSHALRLDCLLNGLRDLRGQPLLNLETTRKDFDEAGILLRPTTLPLGM